MPAHATRRLKVEALGALPTLRGVLAGEGDDMSRIYLQNVIDRSDAFRATPARKVRICAACGDPGEFDPFRAAYPAEHMEALAAHFGGEVCLECADTFEPCQRCHDVSDDVRSTNWGSRECPACEERVQAGRAF